MRKDKGLKIGDRIGKEIIGTDRNGNLIAIPIHPNSYDGTVR